MLAYQGKPGLGFGVKAFVSECPTRRGKAEQHSAPLARPDPCFRADASRYPSLRKDSAFAHIPHNVDHGPRKMYPWRSGTMTAPRGLKLKAARLQIVSRVAVPFLVPLSIYIFAIKLVLFHSA